MPAPMRYVFYAVNGRNAVVLFFVLSGFVLSESLSRSGVTPGRSGNFSCPPRLSHPPFGLRHDGGVGCLSDFPVATDRPWPFRTSLAAQRIFHADTRGRGIRCHLSGLSAEYGLLDALRRAARVAVFCSAVLAHSPAYPPPQRAVDFNRTLDRVVSSDVTAVCFLNIFSALSWESLPTSFEILSTRARR